MPFGLDLKSLIVGAVLVYWVLPLILGALNRPKVSKAA